LLLAVFLITFSGFRIWGFLRNWRFLVETQLRLDRCVGEVAQGFRDSLNSLEASNRRIIQLRIAIQVAELEPWLIPPLQVILIAQAAQQDLIQARWEFRRVHWLVLNGCGKARDRAQPLPALKFIRNAPDSIGPQSLTWEGIMPENFEFQVSHRPRHAAAKVEGGQGEKVSVNLGSPESQSKTKWRANWSVPHKLSWASFP
jgi:hypothetical protein